MAAALAESGVARYLDIVVGTSAGAVNAAALAGGVVDEVASSYSDVFASPEFMSPKKLLRAKPAVDAAKIVAEMERRTRFVERAFAQSGIELVVVTADVDAGAALSLAEFTDREDLARSIQASATLPVLGGSPVAHRGRRLLDGGVAEAIPVDAARRAGATHALVVVTRPAGDLPSHGPMEDLISRYLDRSNKALGALYRARPSRYEATRDAVAAGSYEGMATALLEPGADDLVPSRLTKDAEILRRAREDARATARAAVRSWGLVEAH